MSALQTLAATTEKLFGVNCVFCCDTPVPVRDASMALHLYRIAQEAVANAVKHGQTRNIRVELAGGRPQATLTIANDGRDFPDTLPSSRGIGLEVMSHRAEMIDGALAVRRGATGGTLVICTFSTETDPKEGETGNGR
jgi:signal transduction histidine kinase